MATEIKPIYTMRRIQLELFKVFQSVWFNNLKHKEIIESSYFDNLHLLVAYANKNNLDAIEYIRSIRDILLQSPGVHAKNNTR